MLNAKLIDDIAQHLSTVVPPELHAVKKDLQQNFSSILQSYLHKLDLVTREEFDIQTKVLAKTRAKLEQLEQQIAELEKQLAAK